MKVKPIVRKIVIYRIVCFILFLVIFARPTFLVYQQREKFFWPGYHLQYEAYRSTYYSSQYVQKKNPGIIPDETLTAFAGGIFLKGINPILIVHDHPPLGRYIISLSIFLFDNANTIVIPLTIISVLGVFLIGRLCLNNSLLLSFIPLGIFINEPLFLGKFSYSPVLESVQLPFIIFALYFFIKAITARKYFFWFLLTSLMLGFVISTRFFILGAAELFSMMLYLLLQKNFDRRVIILFILTLPLSLIVLILSYIKTIQAGYSVMQVFSIQKYILAYQQSKLINLFSFWDLILFNRWHTWWADQRIITDDTWILAWPIATVLTFINFILVAFRKLRLTESEKIIFLWVVTYSILLSIGNTTTRYFLPLLPFIYILAVSAVVKMINLYFDTD
ncbi:MAG: hypothetical protein HYV37_02045 [Candidatus Levyibacteriota bacterium]|nr:MAG: hypothetical protein HYV37_02045 [Candidatus Levybacteria bacterium]